MKFIKMEQTYAGRFLKGYELSYENKAGKLKKYEMVSRNSLSSVQDLGNHMDGISIAAMKDGKLLLLREYRMSVGREIYNLCAGLLEEGETIEECIRRELYEETGLSLEKIHCILPPAFSAVGISDIKTQIAFVSVTGELEDHSSQNEQIHAAFYNKEEVANLIKNSEMSDRSQIVASFFSNFSNFSSFFT